MQKLLLNRSSIPFLLGVLVYLGLKLSTLSVRLSDSNIYFVTASHLATGAMLYRDIFFTNFPLHPYVSLVYFSVLRGDVYWYFFTPAIEASIVALLIYAIVLRKTKNYLVSTLSGFVYLFSVIVFITTDHQTGVFFASLMACLSYLFFEKKRYFWVGVFCALMLLVKAYFLPVALTYFVFLLIRKRWGETMRFVAGGVVVGVTILLPFMIFSRREFFDQVFGYSLTRAAGVSKAEVARFFGLRDFLILVILVFNLVCIRKRLFFGLFSIFCFLFFIFYKDTYYLYLNYALPFAALSFMYFYRYMSGVLHAQKMVLPTILIVFFAWNVYVGYSGFSDLGRVENIEEISNLVESQKADFVYGNNDIAPIVSYMSGVAQLNGVIDTNENMFRSGVLNAKEITDDILETKTVLVLHSAYYPTLGVENDVFSEVVEGERVRDNCRLLKRFPIRAEGVTNAIAVLKCW